MQKKKNATQISQLRLYLYSAMSFPVKMLDFRAHTYYYSAAELQIDCHQNYMIDIECMCSQTRDVWASCLFVSSARCVSTTWKRMLPAALLLRSVWWLVTQSVWARHEEIVFFFSVYLELSTEFRMVALRPGCFIVITKPQRQCWCDLRMGMIAMYIHTMIAQDSWFWVRSWCV